VRLQAVRERIVSAKAKKNQKARKGKQAGADNSGKSAKVKPVNTRAECAAAAGVGERTYADGKPSRHHPSDRRRSPAPAPDHPGGGSEIVARFPARSPALPRRRENHRLRKNLLRASPALPRRKTRRAAKLGVLRKLRFLRGL